MARGDVVLIDLPSPVAKPGHEQTGFRPAVVVQADADDASLRTQVIVPFTSQPGALRFPHTIPVNPSQANGLTLPSFLLVSQLRAIDKGRIRNKIGHLEPHHLDQLNTEIARLLELP